MLLHQLLPLVALGLNLLLLASALGSDREQQRNYVFACLAGTLAVWNLGVFGLRTATDPTAAMTWERWLHLGVIALPVLFYHYVLAFLDLPRRTSPALWLGYGLAAAFLMTSPMPLFLRGVRNTTWGYMPVGGPVYPPFFLYVQAYLLLGLIRVLRARRTMQASLRRNRTNLVIVGVVVGLAGGLVDFLRSLADWEHLYPIGIPASPCWWLFSPPLSWRCRYSNG